MKPEEIDKLARAYAMESASGYALDSNVDFMIKCVTAFLQWLSDTHCVVEKEKVKSKYKYISFLRQIGYQDRLDLLESLFDKETFNEAEQ